MIKNDNTTSCADYISLGLIRDLEVLAHANSSILWARDKDYQHQLYLSDTYRTLWGQDCITLYENPSAWYDVAVMNEDLLSEVKDKMNINPEYEKIVGVNYPEQKTTWYQDRSFHLRVSTGETMIVAGCALRLSDKEIGSAEQEAISEKLDLIATQYYQILSTIYQPTSAQASAVDLDSLEKLTKREKDIFKLFIQGKTIAETGTLLNLSPRTVEGYLIKLKDKLSCARKSDLVMKAIENGWLLLNL